MSHVATPVTGDCIDEDKVTQVAFDLDGAKLLGLEHAIDALDAMLKPLTKFILPSGGPSSTHFHLARAVCRRAERHMAPLVGCNSVGQPAGRFLNRLSDFFFAAARVAAVHAGEPEVEFKASTSELRRGFDVSGVTGVSVQ